MKSLLFFTSCIAASLAAPASWTPELAAVYSTTSLKILEARSKGMTSPPSCDLAKVNIVDYLATIPDSPTVKPPGDNVELVQVVVGRGIQNYTCAKADASKPTLMGAIANLYDVSCIAANYPDLLSLISPLAVQYNTSLEADSKLFWLNIKRSGHHYFNSAGFPVFDLTDNKDSPVGVIIADAKNPDMKVDAPKSAVKGQVRAQVNGQTGAVPWLKLNAINGTTNGLAEVYRVDTAGGQAPATCTDQTVGAVISVQYSAQYWFYKTK